MTSLIGVATLGLMRAWGAAESKVASNYSSQYEPFPIPDTPSYTSQDVSVVVALLRPPQIFERCLRSWMRNQPQEIILVTTFDHFEIVLSALEAYKLSKEERAIIKVVHLDEGLSGHRLQHAMGFETAKGEIMAVTDDQILWEGGLLEHMLACFEDPKVGAAGGPIGVQIPEERRAKEIITAWEVAGAKFLFGGRGGATASWVANKWTWCLAGCTWVARTAIFQDPEFLDAFTTETWAGQPLNSGGDNMITRYLLQHGHVIAVQNTDQATNYIKFLTEVPQTYRHPYILYATINRLMRAPVAIVHLLGWVHAFRHQPVLATGFLAYYIYKMVPTHRKFWTTYPYMLSLPNLLAAVAVDFSPIPIGLWGLFTLDTDSWVHGDGSTATKQPGIVTETIKKLNSPALAIGPDSGSWLSNNDGTERPQATIDMQSGGSIQVGQSGATSLDSGHWLSNSTPVEPTQAEEHKNSICTEPAQAEEQDNEGLMNPLDVSKPADEVEAELKTEE
ncbi:hypothetical protein Daus18300_008898 [Diaporthe australafricana]|uniref:Glycosyltransferase family 2 n=1 Tax=Diaporthe australafricana TaxID=127596 RepID=A0ABR3WGY4_9PEZI